MGEAMLARYSSREPQETPLPRSIADDIQQMRELVRVVTLAEREGTSETIVRRDAAIESFRKRLVALHLCR